MKKLLIAMLVLTFILATAAVTYAGTGRWGNATKNYQALPADPSTTDLHDGTYSTATNKCSFCHAVHNAGTSPNYNGTQAYKLLRSPEGGVLGACNFCHIGGGTTAPQPYATAGFSVEAEHRLGVATSVPDTTQATTDLIGADSILDCKDCHNAAPHNANGYGKMFTENYIAAGTLNPVCARCHDGNNVGASFDDRSHPMVVSDDGDTRPGGRDAPVVGNGTSSADCRSCHVDKAGAGAMDSAPGLFPHVSGAARFLNTSAGSLNAGGTTGTLDAICVGCHQWDDGVAKGVGRSF